MLAGLIVSALTFSRDHLIPPMVVATLLVAVASVYDANMLTSDVRPQNFYLSQFAVAFAGSLFMGPLVLMGFGLTLRQSVNHVITFIILFGATQNFGGLVGSAFYSTLQQQRTQYHKQSILQQMQSTDATVTQRLQQYQAGFKPVITDNNLSQQQAQQSLNQIVTREAQIKAYGDIITVNSYIATFLFAWGMINIARKKYIENRQKVAIKQT